MAITRIKTPRNSGIEASIIDMDSKGSLCLHIENRRAGTGTAIVMSEDEMATFVTNIAVVLSNHAQRKASERGQMSRGQITKVE
jgi:hypothetical protein